MAITSAGVVQELLIEREPEAVDRRRRAAKRDSDVRVYPNANDGMSTLAAELTTPEAAECY